MVIDSLLFQDTTFLDYIRGGLRLHFVVAVDFTVSNGDPTQPESLHYYDRDRPENPYTMAIKTIGDIFQDYDYGEESGYYLGWECLVPCVCSEIFPPSFIFCSQNVTCLRLTNPFSYN